MQLISSNYDLMFFGIIIVSAIFALIRGGIAEVLSLSVWFIALWLMHKFGDSIIHLIPNAVTSQFLRSVIVYVVIFIIVAVFLAILRKIFANVISALNLGGLNRIIGFIFGIVRGVFICAIIVILIEMLNLDTSHNWKNSKAYPIIYPTVNLILHAIPESIKNLPAPAKLF